MDYSFNERAGAPVLVSANWYRFSSEERVTQDFVASVGFIWCIRGRGSLLTGGRRVDLGVGDIVRMPLGHAVEYVADRRDPFRVGSLHVLPWHTLDAAVIPRAAHSRGDPLSSAPERQTTTPLSETFELRSFRGADSFIRLATWATELFVSARFSDDDLRAIGVLVANESRRMNDGVHDPSVPVALIEMQGFVVRELASPLSVARVASAGDCSAATARRMFTKYTGQSVQAWIRETRMTEAARLFRSSSMRVSQVATAVGFDDPLYFSRVFRNTFGVAPSKFALGCCEDFGQRN